MHSSNSVPVASLSYILLKDTQDVAAETLLTGGSDNTTDSGCQSKHNLCPSPRLSV